MKRPDRDMTGKSKRVSGTAALVPLGTHLRLMMYGFRRIPGRVFTQDLFALPRHTNLTGIYSLHNNRMLPSALCLVISFLKTTSILCIIQMVLPNLI